MADKTIDDKTNKHKRKRQSMDKGIQSIGIRSMDILYEPIETRVIG